MKLQSLMPVLRTHELQRSIAFYCDRLSFTCSEQTTEWAFVGRDELTLMLALPNAHEPFDRPLFTGSLYFRDRLWQRFQHDADVVYPLEDFDYGMREFAIRDVDGYCLQFGMEIS